nr:response regulator [Actinospica acidiphila]
MNHFPRPATSVLVGPPVRPVPRSAPPVRPVPRSAPRAARTPLASPCGPYPVGVEVGKRRTRWPVPTYSRVVPSTSGRVLVVDDNKVIRQLIRVNLELEGIEVVTAADGAECLEVVHQVRPDLITLDVVMPRLNGLRTAARLRSDPRTAGVPLVIVSACTQHEVESGLDVGVDAFLAKPFEPQELVRVVQSLIDSSTGRVRGSGDTEAAAGHA